MVAIQPFYPATDHPRDPFKCERRSQVAVHPLAGDDPAEVSGYRLRGRLGAGGMGRVYLAFTPGGRPVAVKLLRPELGDDPQFRARFRQEIAAARRVHGLFTAELLDGDPDSSPPWLATAYVAGPSLAQAVAEHGPLPAQAVLLLMAGVAEALAAIHAAGLVHRDLKPSNVLLAADGPRVIDFGIARAADATALTRAGMLVGSPQYMAPEQIHGGQVAAAADVFALGALAAYAATGRPPFGDGDQAAVLYRVLHADPDLGGCPDPLLRLIQGCLAKDPSARPGLAQIIGQCRAWVPAGTLEFTASWLPAAIAADLPPHPATRTFPLPPGTEPAARLTGPGPDGDQPPRQHRRQSRTALAALVAAGVLAAALAWYGLAAVFHHYSAAAASHPARDAGNLDPCLFGTWLMRTESNRLPDGQYETYIDHGGTMTFLPDGVTRTDYGGGATQATTVSGVTWTYTYVGSTTGRYSTNDRVLRLRDMSGHISQTELENGSYYSSTNYGAAFPWPQPYTCSAQTLRLSAPGGFTDVLTKAS
jgi:hypothetical protein